MRKLRCVPLLLCLVSCENLGKRKLFEGCLVGILKDEQAVPLFSAIATSQGLLHPNQMSDMWTKNWFWSPKISSEHIAPWWKCSSQMISPKVYVQVKGDLFPVVFWIVASSWWCSSVPLLKFLKIVCSWWTGAASSAAYPWWGCGAWAIWRL